MPDERQLDPKIMRELEAAGLPTIPTLALSDLPKSIWSRLMGPAKASQEVMKSGEIGAASVTPQQTLEMGSALLPAFGRAGSGLGVGGGSSGAPKEALAFIRNMRGLVASMERKYKELSDMYKIMPDGPQKEQARVLVEGSRTTIDYHKNQLAMAVEQGKKRWGEDFDLGPPGSGELGVGGGRPPIGGTRGSNFLTPTSKELERFWNRVDAYRSVGRIAWAEGVSQHTVRARLESPFWTRPPNMRRMSPQMVAQMDGLQTVAPKRPTPGDVKTFWDVIDRYQQLRNWRAPVKQILKISDAQLDQRLNNPMWRRNAQNRRPDDDVSAGGIMAGGHEVDDRGPLPETDMANELNRALILRRQRRELGLPEDMRQDPHQRKPAAQDKIKEQEWMREFEQYDPKGPREGDDPRLHPEPRGKVTDTTRDNFYAAFGVSSGM